MAGISSSSMRVQSTGDLVPSEASGACAGSDSALAGGALAAGRGGSRPALQQPCSTLPPGTVSCTRYSKSVLPSASDRLSAQCCCWMRARYGRASAALPRQSTSGVRPSPLTPSLPVRAMPSGTGPPNSSSKRALSLSTIRFQDGSLPRQENWRTARTRLRPPSGPPTLGVPAAVRARPGVAFGLGAGSAARGTGSGTRSESAACTGLAGGSRSAGRAAAVATCAAGASFAVGAGSATGAGDAVCAGPATGAVFALGAGSATGAGDAVGAGSATDAGFAVSADAAPDAGVLAGAGSATEAGVAAALGGAARASRGSTTARAAANPSRGKSATTDLPCAVR